MKAQIVEEQLNNDNHAPVGRHPFNLSLTAVFSSIAFMLAAHLYRWMNAMFNHDSMGVFQADRTLQISIGRIFNPLYLKIRGTLAAPFLIALFGGAFLVLSAVLTVHILRLKKTSSIILCTGLLVTFESITYTNAVFNNVFDVYMLAMLFATLSACLIITRRFRKIFRLPLAVICAVLSLGLYQSYIEVTIVLIILVLIRDLLEGSKTGETLKKGAIALVLILAAGVIYYIILQIVLHVNGISLRDTYNSLNGILDFRNTSVADLIWRTWKRPFSYLFSQEIANRMLSAVINLIIACAALAGTIYIVYRRKLYKWSIVMLAVLVLILPLAGNFTFFLSRGFKHTLMVYSFAFFAVGFIMIYDLIMDAAWMKAYASRTVCIVISVICGILIMNHIIFSNQFYLKKHLEAEAGLAFMNRMVMRMEETDGYQAGKTKVAILGDPSESPIAIDRPGFDIERDNFLGTQNHVSVSYYGSYTSFFNYILGYPVNLVPLPELQELIDNTEVQAMPVYPANGSVKMVSDTLVIRVSEDLRPQENKYNIN